MKRLETRTPENIPPPSSQSVVAAPIMEDKEVMWSSDGEEAVDGGEISSSSDANDVSVKQIHLSGESSIHSSNSTKLEDNEKAIKFLSNEVEDSIGGVRCETENPSGNVSHGDEARAQQFRQWAVENQISHTALNSLLVILRQNYDASLPMDARTLLKTPANQSSLIKNMCGSQYYHFGLYKAVCDFLSRNDDDTSLQILENFRLSMKVNCDGIPLHRSSKAQFWPILVSFSCEGLKTKHSPVIVGIFYGISKPNNIDVYLKEFIDELESLSSRCSFGNHLISIKVSCFVCDAPARQFLKQITSYNGYSGCERC